MFRTFNCVQTRSLWDLDRNTSREVCENLVSTLGTQLYAYTGTEIKIVHKETELANFYCLKK